MRCTTSTCKRLVLALTAHHQPRIDESTLVRQAGVQHDPGRLFDLALDGLILTLEQQLNHTKTP